MSSELPDNSKLARLFFEVISKTSVDNETVLMAMRQISRCSGQIAQEFENAGTLQNFKIPKLARKFYPLLEKILRDGVDVASEVWVKGDIANQRAKQFLGVPGSSLAHVKTEEPSPGWENTLRKLEGE
jgi:hypothetical protein